MKDYFRSRLQFPKYCQLAIEPSSLIHRAQNRPVGSFNSKISTDIFSQISSLDQVVSSNLRFPYNARGDRCLGGLQRVDVDQSIPGGPVAAEIGRPQFEW